MSESGKQTNPLALAVLAILLERPMHPYEMAATLRLRRKEMSIKLKYGSLYTVVEQLQRDQLIVPLETVREGKRPERTVYGLTPAGKTRMHDWLSGMLRMPAKEYPQFEAALSLIAAIPPDEALLLLEDRGLRLGRLSEELRAGHDVALQMGVQPLFLVENEFRMEMVRAERDFVAELTRRMKDDKSYTRVWTVFHEDLAKRDRDQPDDGKVSK